MVTPRYFRPSKVEWKGRTKIITWVKRKKILTDFPIKDKMGQLQLKILFKKKRRIPITEFGYSHIGILSDVNEYRDAKVFSLRSAWGKVPFSPDSFEITGERFIYVATIDMKEEGYPELTQEITI